MFIDGCFWHGCPDHGTRTFKTNAVYWEQKIIGNAARDADTVQQLTAAGWRVVRFWEHVDPVVAADAIEAEARTRA